MSEWIAADWPAPPTVVALSTTRGGGASRGEFASLNLGDHVGDDPQAVAANREQLLASCQGLREIQWLQQVHGTELCHVGTRAGEPAAADGAITSACGIACAVLTADCVPVVLCDQHGRQVAALHAGWRGLCAGIIARAVTAFDAPAAELIAWIGPAISAAHFEVGAEVRDQFLREMALPAADIESAFVPAARRGHYMADLAGLARSQLQALGVASVSGGNLCTYADDQRFYSYRRDGRSGRLATLVYIRDS